MQKVICTDFIENSIFQFYTDWSRLDESRKKEATKKITVHNTKIEEV